MKLDFFGAVVEFRGVEADLRDARFFYSYHETSPEKPADTLVELTCVDWTERGFFTSLLAKDKLRKRVRISTRDQYEWGEVLDHEFTHWSDVASPLPPYRHSSLWHSVATRPGNVVRTPTGLGVMVCGSNYVGKTAVCLELCDRGWDLVSDSVVVLDASHGIALPYNSPLGFRRRSLTTRTHIFEHIDTRETVNPDTGLVVLATPQDVLGRPNSESTSIDVILNLTRDVSGACRIRSGATGPSSWYTGADIEQVRSHVPNSLFHVQLRPDTSPSEAADLIAKELAA